MGLTDWLNPKGNVAEEESLAMLERTTQDEGVDEEVPRSRRGSPERKEIRRRRAQPQTQDTGKFIFVALPCRSIVMT